MFNDLNQVLQHWATVQPDAIAYRELDSRGRERAHIRWHELQQRVQTTARQLAGLPATQHSILLLFPAGIDFVVAFLATLLAGRIAVPTARPAAVGLKRALPRLQRIAADCQATVVLADPAFLTDARAQGEQVWLDLQAYQWPSWPLSTGGGTLPDADPDAVAYLQYSSGSTGQPKGVMISQRNLLNNLQQLAQRSGLLQPAVTLEWMPHFHDYGLVHGLMLALYTGSEHIILPPMALLRDPGVWLSSISRYRAVSSGGPNFAYQLCLDRIPEAELAALELSCWRWAHCGAEPIKARTLSRFEARFVACGLQPGVLHGGYGMAEATLFVSSGLPGQPRLDQPVRPGDREAATVACGTPFQAEDVCIVDPDTRLPSAAGQVGEIWISTRNPCVAQGYWQDPVLTQAIFQAQRQDEAGCYLRTGDLGYWAGTQLVISGRLKDLIIHQGRNLVPTDIEWLVQQDRPLLRVDGGAAFSVESEHGERLVMVQEVEKEATAATLLAYALDIQQALAEEHGITLDELLFTTPGSVPKTSSGKIQRRESRLLWQQDAFPARYRFRAEQLQPTMTDTPEDILPWLMGQLAEQLQQPVAGLDPERSLFELGMSSSGVTALYERVYRQHPEWKLDLIDLFQAPSLAALAAHIQQRCTQATEPAHPAGRQAHAARRRERLAD